MKAYGNCGFCSCIILLEVIRPVCIIKTLKLFKGPLVDIDVLIICCEVQYFEYNLVTRPQGHCYNYLLCKVFKTINAMVQLKLCARPMFMPYLGTLKIPIYICTPITGSPSFGLHRNDNLIPT